jgi:hypothetical protein
LPCAKTQAHDKDSFCRKLRMGHMANSVFAVSCVWDTWQTLTLGWLGNIHCLFCRRRALCRGQLTAKLRFAVCPLGHTRQSCCCRASNVWQLFDPRQTRSLPCALGFAHDNDLGTHGKAPESGSAGRTAALRRSQLSPALRIAVYYYEDHGRLLQRDWALGQCWTQTGLVRLRPMRDPRAI